MNPGAWSKVRGLAKAVVNESLITEGVSIAREVIQVSEGGVIGGDIPFLLRDLISPERYDALSSFTPSITIGLNRPVNVTNTSDWGRKCSNVPTFRAPSGVSDNGGLLWLPCDLIGPNALASADEAAYVGVFAPGSFIGENLFSGLEFLDAPYLYRACTRGRPDSPARAIPQDVRERLATMRIAIGALSGTEGGGSLLWPGYATLVYQTITTYAPWNYVTALGGLIGTRVAKFASGETSTVGVTGAYTGANEAFEFADRGFFTRVGSAGTELESPTCVLATPVHIQRWLNVIDAFITYDGSSVVDASLNDRPAWERALFARRGSYGS